MRFVGLGSPFLTGNQGWYVSITVNNVNGVCFGGLKVPRFPWYLLQPVKLWQFGPIRIEGKRKGVPPSQIIPE